MIYDETSFFHRTERLLGSDVVERLRKSRVAIFGLGGVGGWTAESLARTGIGHLTLVDHDLVSPTNINRQMPATTATVGRVKVEVVKERLLDVNPVLDVCTKRVFYTAENADEFNLDEYDYVIDAIDSLQDKALLIVRATRSRTRLFSSMGAALKLDPTRVSVTEFWNVKGCPLAAALRRKFKKGNLRPAKKFQCVYSDELLPNLGESKEETAFKACINGNLAHITAIFGFTLAGLVVRDIVKRVASEEIVVG